MMRPLLAVSLVSAILGCGSGDGGTGSGGSGGSQPKCDPAAGCLSHSFGTQTIEAGAEVSGLCQSWTLDNPDELWVNTVELHNDGAYHHSNWFFVPNTDFDQPDGSWDCDAAKFDELTAAVDGGVLFAQSTQSKEETQKFPAGVAVRIPPYSRVIGSTHLLNVAPTKLVTSLGMTITTIPKADVKVKLAPFRLTYHDLHIPPQSKAEFTSSCDFRSSLAMGTPFALKLYYVLPHYHKLGQHFGLQYLGGPNDGKEIDSIAGFNGEARGKTFDPPIDMAQANGFTFSCTFQNPTTEEVVWGIGKEEMCEMLGFADSSMVYDAYVDDGKNMVGPTQNGVVTNSGPCTILALPWNQDKAGGVPPTH